LLAAVSRCLVPERIKDALSLKYSQSGLPRKLAVHFDKHDRMRH
jgi:hypothetical protein